MKCKLNDICFIVKSIRPVNIGLVVDCKEYLGYYLMDDIIEISGERYVAIISDNYWLIENKNSSIETHYGKAKNSYIPDLWLNPIKEDGLTDDTATEKTIENDVHA